MNKHLNLEFNLLIDRINEKMNKYNITYNEVVNITGCGYNEIYRLLTKQTMRPKVIRVLKILDSLDVKYYKINNVLNLKNIPSYILNDEDIKKIKSSDNKILSFYRVKIKKLEITSKYMSSLLGINYSVLSRSLNNQTVDFVLAVNIMRVLKSSYSEMLWVWGNIPRYPYRNKIKEETNPFFNYAKNYIRTNTYKSYKYLIFKHLKTKTIYLLNGNYFSDEYALLYLNYLYKKIGYSFYEFDMNFLKNESEIEELKKDYHFVFLNEKNTLLEIQGNNLLKRKHFLLFSYLDYIESEVKYNTKDI